MDKKKNIDYIVKRRVEIEILVWGFWGLEVWKLAEDIGDVDVCGVTGSKIV